jgi:hypothetical protein
METRLSDTELRGLGTVREFEQRLTYTREDRPGMSRAEAILKLRETHPALVEAMRNHPDRVERRD